MVSAIIYLLGVLSVGLVVDVFIVALTGLDQIDELTDTSTQSETG